ncbi:hypothetical protein PQ469_25590 [Mucilaginibacter sp. KACC 22773]|uniref:hypothetical protein n=1 Tax=Mucilaginibacter sp. KACC 22773 TaxID=3025671 RepID=UPI00236607CF|nr:hypothetical protein [Mucilaginibacter sp. KACC 22773]WDF81496.1 hypothetical protein PQ469_25590 [Mucilaginibacter sp. KACC 22773]
MGYKLAGRKWLCEREVNISRMKNLLLTMLLSTLVLPVLAQKISYKSVANDDLVEVLNSIEDYHTIQTPDNSIVVNVFLVARPYESAGNPETDETKEAIYVATSECDLAPEQHLFKLTSVYNAKIISWSKSKKNPQFVFTYGPVNKLKSVIVSVSLRGLKIEEEAM